MKRIGIYGGTFDPIHLGHIHLIEELFARDLVDELIVIPAGKPWLRPAAPTATPKDRLAMVNLAIAELSPAILSKVRVSSAEIDREGATYTIDTVEEIQSANPSSQLILVIGSDVLESIERWHRIAELRKMVEILLIARNGDGLEIGALPISATELRNSPNLHEGDLPATVASYIKEKNLYVR